MFYSFHTYSAEDDSATVKGITCGSGLSTSYLTATLSLTQGLHSGDGPLEDGSSQGSGGNYTNLENVPYRTNESHLSAQHFQQQGGQNETHPQLSEYPNFYDRGSLPFEPYNNSNSKFVHPVPWDHVYSPDTLSNNNALAVVAPTYPQSLPIESDEYAAQTQDHHQTVCPYTSSGNSYTGYYNLPNGVIGDSESDMSAYRPMTTVGHPVSAGMIGSSGFNGFVASGPSSMYLQNSNSSGTNSNSYYSQTLPIYNHSTFGNDYLPPMAPNCIIPNDCQTLPQAVIPNSFPMIDYHGDSKGIHPEPGTTRTARDHYWVGGNQITTAGSGFPSTISTDDMMGQMDAAEKLQDVPVTYGGRSVFGFAMCNRTDGEGLFAPRIQSNLSRESNGNPFSIDLLNQNMWYDFYQNQTEMIITKAGRRMFPYLSIEISGLDEIKQYNIFVDVQQISNQVLKYHSGRWVPNGEGELWPPTGSSRGRIYMHPDSPNSGRHWMKQEIHFMKLKLTNNKIISEEDDGKMIVVNSMHNYIPRINVVEVDSQTMNKFYAVATFPVTEFIVVTAYQNTEVTELKIKYNPFAKGFREMNKGFTTSLSTK